MTDSQNTGNLLVNESESLNPIRKNTSETVLIDRDYQTIERNPGEPRTSAETGLQSSLEVQVKVINPKKKKSKATSDRQRADPPVAGTEQTGLENEQQNPEYDEDSEEGQEELVLKYGAAHVIKLFIPVTLCLIFVIISLSLITSYQESGGATLIYTPFNEDSQQSSGTKLWMSIANASIFIGVVVVMTIVLILLYKFHCYKIIHGWLAFSSLMLLFFFTYMFVSELFKQFNLVTDMFTVSILLWNFGMVGMFAIHWKGPLFLQQIFLIFSCVQMALIFIKYLPEWTTWVLLAFISIWDLIAVLCPFGPLRILVETAKSRNDTLFPAMVYSSAIMYTLIANIDETLSSDRNRANNENRNENDAIALQTGSINPNAGQDEDDDGGFNDTSNLPSQIRTNGNSETVRNRHRESNNRQANRQNIEELEQQQQDEQENGVKLGLGDFIFYSILVGKASILGDWNTVIACFVAILIGLCLTLVLLAIFHKPLPALPISLLFGLIFYFSTNLVVRPFYDNLTYKQIFI